MGGRVFDSNAFALQSFTGSLFELVERRSRFLLGFPELITFGFGQHPNSIVGREQLPFDPGQLVLGPRESLPNQIAGGDWSFTLGFKQDGLQGRQVVIAIGHVDAQHQLCPPVAFGRAAGEIRVIALGQDAVDPHDLASRFDGRRRPGGQGSRRGTFRSAIEAVPVRFIDYVVDQFGVFALDLGWCNVRIFFQAGEEVSHFLEFCPERSDLFLEIANPGFHLGSELAEQQFKRFPFVEPSRQFAALNGDLEE